MDIPFDFEVKGRVHQAGKYVIEQPVDDHGQRMIWMLSNDEGSQALLAKSKLDKENIEKPSMIFNRYGKKYFLTSFITAGYKIELPTSKAERDAGQDKGKNLAKAAPREIVVVEALVE